MSERVVQVAAGRLAGWLDGFGQRHGEVRVEADAGEVRLAGADGARAWITVPFGPLRPVGSAEDPCSVLIEHVTRSRTLGVLLVRRGGYAAGVFAGTDLVASKVGSAYVQGATRAGGWSQKRFARRRDNQANAAFAAAADIAVQVLVPHVAALDALICGGDRAAVAEVLTDRRLADVGARRRDPFLAVGDPRLRVLQATPAQFTSVRITLDP